MEELVNIERTLELQIYTNSLKYYKTLPRGYREGQKIVVSQTLCYIFYKIYHTYLYKANYADLYTILYRKLATLFKWHNRNEKINNCKNNLIYVDIEDILFFMLYIRANSLYTSTMLFKKNVMIILDIYRLKMKIKIKIKWKN